MKIRRVTTGHDGEGRSVFVTDAEVEPEGWHLWGGDEAPTFPDAGDPPGRLRAFPMVGGYRFGIIELPPGIAGGSPYPDEERVMQATKHGMRLEVGQPGVHTTDTIDFEVILSGEIVLELDDGAERVLRAGDTVVQNGTRHRWRVEGTEPAVMAVFMVGAQRS
jgi:hypothetical protein